MTAASVTPIGMRAVEPGSPIRVLIAEDETHLGTILEQFMTARGFAVQIVRDGRAALDALRTDAFDVALLDVVMPEVDGLEVLRLVREEPLPPEIIVITGNGTIETAIAALRLGAYDFLSKPYRMAEIEALVRRAWEKRMLARDNQRLASRLRRAEPLREFVTRFAPLTAVLSMAEKMVSSPSPVLVTGERGTGKALLAHQLHHRGDTPDAPFVRVSCAPARPSFARELCGVERGAAENGERQLGLFELASGGTLYLSHIDQLDAAQQALLLSVLETGQVARVGGAQPLPVSVRVVASTTVDLDARVRDGRFSEALLHRINAMRIALPPLRERRTDIPLLAEHFCAQATADAPQRVSYRVSDEAMMRLEQYDWPGNVGELRSVIARAAPLADDGVIGPAALALPVALRGDAHEHTAAGAADGDGTSAGVLTLTALERKHIADVLDRTNWHQGRTADLLGISPKTLYRKIREYGFKRPSGRAT